MTEPQAPTGVVSVLALGPALGSPTIDGAAVVECVDATPDRLPAGAALLRAAATARGEVLVVCAGGTAVDPSIVASLTSTFRAAPAIGAAVPRVLWPDGTLAEAGAVIGGDAAMASCGAGDDPDRSEYAFARPVYGTRFGCVALRRDLVRVMLIDPALDDADELMAYLFTQVHALGRDVVYLPTWSVVASPRPMAGPVGIGHEAGAGERMLLVTRTLSGELSPWSDAGSFDLLEAVAAVSPKTSLTVVVAEALGNGDAIAGLRARGIEVAGGSTDWSRWFAARAYRFSHVIVTDGGLQSGLGHYVMESQPQAAKVLMTASLGFRAIEAMVPVTPYLERVGHEYVRAAAAAQVGELVSQFDAVWCARIDDYHFLSGMLRDRLIKLLPLPVAPPSGGDRSHGERRGLAVVASPAADIVAAHEDAAVCAAKEIFAHLHRRDPRIGLTVVADRPSPMVEQLARLPGVVIEHPGDDGVPALLAQARVVLAPYRHGIGGPAVIWAAMAAGTPFLSTEVGARGAMVGDLGRQGVVRDPQQMEDRASTLHDDAGAWSRYRTTMEQLRRDQYSWAGFAAAVADALVELGVRPAAAGSRHRETGARRPAAATSRPRVAAPALRMPTSTDGLPVDIAAELAETVRYRLWCQRRGPTEPVLASLRAAVRALSPGPKISVITQVRRGQAARLAATLASLREQIYQDWELCLGRDGTDSDVTTATLAAAADPRVRVVEVASPAGRAASANAALAMASGDYVAFVDAGDRLKPHALAQVARWLDQDPSLDLLYSDEDRIDESGQVYEPEFKPDWSPDLLMCRNYIGHLVVARRRLLDKLGGLRSGFDGAEEYDLLLRLMEETDRIAHIPEALYTRPVEPGPLEPGAAEPRTAVPAATGPRYSEAAKVAIGEAMRRRGEPGSVDDGLVPGSYRARYRIPGSPRVAIVIPTRDKGDMLGRCVDSIIQKSTYRNYEIVVIDNDSKDPATLQYLATFPGRVLRYPAPFNYARMLNLAVQSLECDALLFLNNDTEVINADWIEALLEHGMRPTVGAVGCRLYFPDGRLQHEGIFVGILGVAYNIDHGGLWDLGELVRNCSAVTGACVMIRPAVYWAIGGNDERLRVAYNDVDICLRLRQAGYEVVYTPHARLSHFEGASRAKYEHVDDRAWFSTRWRPFEEWDPFYNRSLDRNRLFKIAM